MLLLTRNPGQCIVIGDDIRIIVTSVDHNQVCIGIEAPRAIPVHREEIYLRIRDERAAHSARASS